MGEPSFSNPVTPAAAQNFFAKMLNFDSMIGPTLIRIMYFVGLVFIALFGVGLLGMGLISLGGYSPASGFLLILMAPILVIIYAILWRFACEMWILTFKIYDRLGEIKNKLPG